MQFLCPDPYPTFKWRTELGALEVLSEPIRDIHLDWTTTFLELIDQPKSFLYLGNKPVEKVLSTVLLVEIPNKFFQQFRSMFRFCLGLLY